ncbi:hypothetical protein [Nostoc sp.]|uniref:hypothetical protein n=1 Tax=Nostoc sp. TaxID=1180 RepID=UPI002FF8BC20
MVISDVGYQFFTTVNLVVVEVDFYGFQGFGGYGLGLVGDEVIEFSLGCGLVVNLLKLGGLVGDDCVYLSFSRSSVPSGCYVTFGGDSFEAGEVVTAKGLLCVSWMCDD